jgi:hypothetical protein
MRNPDELDRKGADVHYVARLDAVKQHIAEQVMLLEFALRQTGSEMGTIDRNVKFLE